MAIARARKGATRSCLAKLGDRHPVTRPISIPECSRYRNRIRVEVERGTLETTPR